MKHLMKLAKGNPVLVIGAAGLGGWLLGSGIFALPFSLPGLPAPHPTTAAAPAAPATLPVTQGSSATIASTSATMPATTTAADPLAGWGI